MAQTKSQLVTYVTDKFRVTTDAVVTRAKGFYDVRYRMIWDRFYWKQSKVSESQSVTAGTQDVTLTSAIDRVVAVRWDGNQILPVNQEQVFQINATSWDASGTPLAFSELPKDSSGLTRIRLYEIPQVTRTLVVLGKAPSETLTDGQSPRLGGIDQCLQAYVLGDLWQSIRQFAKADILYNEAENFLAAMIKIEQEQTAYSNRIIPSGDADYSRNDLFF
jgi:hypothetical protein